MKKIITCFFAVMALILTFSLNSYSADNGMYIEPRIGLSVLNGSYLDTNGKHDTSGFGTDAGFLGGLSVGYDWMPIFKAPFRTEVAYDIRTTTFFTHDHHDTRAIAPQTVFANGYFDIDTGTDFVPYIGGGVGAAFINTNTNFAWNVGAGTAYKLTDNSALTLGYRFVDFGNFEDRHVKGHLYGHEIMAGFRYTF